MIKNDSTQTGTDKIRNDIKMEIIRYKITIYELGNDTVKYPGTRK